MKNYEAVTTANTTTTENLHNTKENPPVNSNVPPPHINHSYILQQHTMKRTNHHHTMIKNETLNTPNRICTTQKKTPSWIQGCKHHTSITINILQHHRIADIMPHTLTPTSPFKSCNVGTHQPTNKNTKKREHDQVYYLHKKTSQHTTHKPRTPSTWHPHTSSPQQYEHNAQQQHITRPTARDIIPTLNTTKHNNHTQYTTHPRHLG
jgi:hypothetical protein